MEQEKDIANEERPSLLESVDFQNLSSRGCYYIGLKFLCFGITRLVFELVEWDPNKFIFEDIIQLAMVFCYLFINIGIGLFLEKVDIKLVFLGNLAMIAIESILVITSSFSQLLIILLFSVALYVVIMGWAHKNLPRFTIVVAFCLLIIFIFMLMIITLVVYKQDFQEGKITQSLTNAFIGLYTYCLWLTIFQFDQSKVEFLSGLKIFFGLGYDFSCVLRQILKEMKIEWDE